MDACTVPPAVPGAVDPADDPAGRSGPAVERAHRARGRRGGPRAGWDSLTPTEREVVGHVAVGRSNAEIGGLMLVSSGTVRSHLRSVFAKLGVRRRTELAARP